jgi:hypothetical protein
MPGGRGGAGRGRSARDPPLPQDGCESLITSPLAAPSGVAKHRRCSRPSGLDDGVPLVKPLLRVVGAVARNRALAAVMLAYAVFSATQNAVWIAMLAYAYNRGGAPTAGAVAVAQLVPAALLAPVAAAVADRRSPVGVLVGGWLAGPSGSARGRGSKGCRRRHMVGPSGGSAAGRVDPRAGAQAYLGARRRLRRHDGDGVTHRACDRSVLVGGPAAAGRGRVAGAGRTASVGRARRRWDLHRYAAGAKAWSPSPAACGSSGGPACAPPTTAPVVRPGAA